MSQDQDLSRRLSFMRIDDNTRGALRAAEPAVRAAMGPALEDFYGQMRRFPEVARLFASDSQMATAQGAQERHWDRIMKGTFDQGYAESVQRVGAVHARIGLEPRWYIGGYALVIEGLIKSLIADAESGKKGLFNRGDGGAALADRMVAVVKAALLDMDFVISIYLEIAETERKASEAARLEMEAAQKIVVDETARGLSALADGNLAHRIEVEFGGDYAKLRSDFNAAMDSLEQAMGTISSNAHSMQTGAGEISHAADDLSRRTEQQAATLEETAAALDEITATVRRTAEGAQRATVVVGDARQDAETSGVVVSKAVSAMGEIERSADQISQIIGVIDEIAVQTNLLALNAGVEAARAGDAGRGFAVVASEVRALAQRSAEAAKEIKSLISASTSQVKEGVTLVGQTGQALGAIVGRVSEINGLMAEINASAQEQATALSQVNTAVNQMDQTTQQNAAMVEQSTAASHNLNQESAELSRLVSRFRTSAGTTPSAQTRRPAPVNAVRAAQSRIADFASQPAPRRAAAGGRPAASTDGWEEF
jgi:methyl-accepting chemotaxis protein